MRTLNFADSDGALNALIHALHTGGYASKEARTARKLIRKMKAIAIEDSATQVPTFRLKDGSTEVKLEDSEFKMLRKKFDAVTDWLPTAVDAAASAEDVLEAAKEDE